MMFALGIRYLNGWAMATHPADRNRAEWPPHPDRIFMALAAAHFETDGNDDERRALEWLQSLPAPALNMRDASQREIVTSYVPVNDTEITRRGDDAKRLGAIQELPSLAKAKDAGLALIPEHRVRQARSFPVSVPDANGDLDGFDPHMPRVYLTWTATETQASHRQALESLCAKVTSIGHSASLVQMWVEPSPPAANLIPLDGVATQYRLRVTSDGRLDYLESRHKIGQRPTSSLWQGYGEALPAGINSPILTSCFDSTLLILRRVEGPRLGLESTLQLTEAIRNTLMSQCAVQPPPAWISGHTTDGSPLQEPHLAFFPLPHVGYDHAEGHLLGAAIAVPRDISAAEQQRCLGAELFDEQGQPRELEIRMGRIGVWKVTLDDGNDSRVALQSNTWTAAQIGDRNRIDARRWATVTPIVFDRHPKKSGDAERTIAASCQRIGLPAPADVIVESVSMFIGSPHSRRFPNMQRKSGGNLHHTHAILTFKEPVVGPVLVGAGRYRGYGLCRPLRDGGGM